MVITADKAVAGKPKAETLATPLAAFTLSGAPIAAPLPATNDTPALLDGVPGVAAAAAGGGVSSLPVIHGFADDWSLQYDGAGVRDIPYLGFPDVRMDMIYNRSTFANALCEGGFDWGRSMRASIGNTPSTT